jgi:hypothetical protein
LLIGEGFDIGVTGVVIDRHMEKVVPPSTAGSGGHARLDKLGQDALAPVSRDTGQHR